MSKLPSPFFLSRISSSPGKQSLKLTLIVETVNPVDAGALVVSSQEEEVLRVLDLVGEQEADGLQTLLASVHVVTEEEVVGLGREAAVFEQTKQVVVLTVDVA